MKGKNLTQIKDGQFRGEIAQPVSLAIKSITDAGEFEGYGSVWDVVDNGDDRMMRGAFRDSLAARPAERVKMLWQHDSREVIGVWTDIHEDDRGLSVKGRLLLDVTKGREAHSLLTAGAVDGLSIGYRTRQHEIDRDSGVRTLTKVDLMEISVVTFPMLESATINLVKGDALPTEREFERMLQRDVGFSAKQAKAIIALGYKALLEDERDAGTQGAAGETDEFNEVIRRFAQALRT